MSSLGPPKSAILVRGPGAESNRGQALWLRSQRSWEKTSTCRCQRRIFFGTLGKGTEADRMHKVYRGSPEQLIQWRHAVAPLQAAWAGRR